MIYFLKTKISPSKENKNIEIILSQVYGIGRNRAVSVCKKLGLNPKGLFKKLDNRTVKRLSNYIDFYFTHGFHLRLLRKGNIKKLKRIGSYRGRRHVRGYLVRGQSSKNKARREHG